MEVKDSKFTNGLSKVCVCDDPHPLLVQNLTCRNAGPAWSSKYHTGCETVRRKSDV